MSKKSDSKQNRITQSARDRNPNYGGFKASLDNRSRQLSEQITTVKEIIPAPVVKKE
jgi:hypothetical protein